jgi:aerobic C4-dicarboxylate transport protein
MLVTSKGAAAVSGDSFVVFAATVTAIGVLAMEGLALAYTVLCPWPLPPATPSETAWRWWWCWGEFTEQTAKAEYSRVLGRNPEAAL